jgi:RNA polymerase sigma-70 factor (ECF subfamily)
VIQYYQRAVFKYLLALMRDVDRADDVFQDFALRFVRGDFKTWEPGRGRFRDYLKMSLRNLAMDRYRKEQQGKLQTLAEGMEPVVADLPHAEAERVFEQTWSEEALRRAWEALRRFEQDNDQPVHTVLRCKSAKPELRSHQIAEVLTAQLGREITAAWVRKWLAVARDIFAELLLNEVERSLPEPGLDELEREVAELGLLQYCRKALERRRQQTEASR